MNDGGPQSHTDLLVRAFGFTHADLDANRHGRLSQRQRRYLERLQIGFALRFFIGLMAGAIAIVLTLTASRTPLALLVGVGGALFCWGWAAAQAVAERRIARDLRSGPRRLQATPRIVPLGRQSPLARLVVGDWSCLIRADAAAIFKPQETYVIYCAYHSRFLLSLERAK